jgi:glycosyltransferase involved in cell wall biosynthesis
MYENGRTCNVLPEFMMLQQSDLQNEPPRSIARVQTSARVILDFTDLIGHLARGGSVSGIPRVVFEFGNAAAALASDQNIDLQFGFFDQSQAKYFRLTHPVGPGANGRTLDWLLSEPTFRRGYPRPIDLSRLSRKYAQRPIKRGLHMAYAQCRLVGRRVTSHMLRVLKQRTRFSEIRFRPGDVLLMLGSGWAAAPFIDHIEPLQKAGVVIPMVLIHDLIPFLHLKNDDSIPAAIFEPWLDRVAKMGCQLLTVSEATKSDLSNHLAGKNIDIHPIHVARLPHEFSRPAPDALTPEIQTIISSNYCLFVGPVSGRKNAKRLLEAWTKVLTRVGRERMPCLVITSSRGAEEIYESHIRPIESHVRLLRRPGDFALSELYRHAAFTIFPSLYEGWGLPVGESLWHGTPCITSNRSSMPEVGGALCDYVDPTSVDSIAEAVERFARDRDYRDARAAAIKRAKLRTWTDFAESVLEAAVRHPSSLEARAAAEFIA